MKTKIFGKKKIKIKKLSRGDLKNVKKLQNFINSLIKENAQILLNKELSLKQEKKWLEEQLRRIKNRKTVFLIAEHNDIVVGTTQIDLRKERQNHLGNFGITIRKGYRGIGLGTYLTNEIIKLAKRELKPKPKIIKLGVFSTNKIAIRFYRKYGFKKVAKIPKHNQFKGKLVDEIIMFLDLS
ncbi:MAG: GNAT family N-acetyltransferase [Candidatus Nealsonbacteria bacterium]|nr:MAG: GNAT family N-acetyltransferase [Candidatus Nealsonbacteria bacterium]